MGAFGDGLLSLPREVLHEFATPMDFKSESEGELYPKARTAREAAMTPEQR